MRVQVCLLSGLMLVGAACAREDDAIDDRLVVCGATIHGVDTADCFPNDSEEEGGEETGGDDTTTGDGDDDGAPACGYRTAPQTEWGAKCKADNVACFRDEHFASAFPEGLYLGCGVLTVNLTNSEAVKRALPTAGSPRALHPDEAGAYDGDGDPTVQTALFGEAAALALAVGFDALPGYEPADPPVPLRDLLLGDDSVCAGLTVQDVLDEADGVLGGCGSAFTASEVAGCLAAINAAFADDETCSALFEPPPAV